MGMRAVDSKLFISNRAWLWRLAADACTLSVICLGWLAIANSNRPFVFMLLLILAGLLDGIDGALAQRSGGPSFHGTVLDVVADATTFGLAPLVFSEFQSRLSSTLFGVCAIIFMTAAIGRLVRSARQYLHKSASYIGLPMPAAGILLAGLALLIHGGWFCAALSILSILAVSRLSYPKPAWLWRNERQLLVFVILGSAGLAFFHFPSAIVAALLSYTLHPCLDRLRT